MQRLLVTVMAVALGAGSAQAADSWGLENERIVLIEGRVVDLLCELAGDCAPGCGGGTRQLGLVEASGRLLPLVKGNVNFANAVPDLLPHCGRTVQLDGLLVESPAMPVLFVQALRGSEAEPWRPTTAFAEQWKARHGEAEEWMRADPAVKAAIARNGVLGIPGLKPE